MIMVTSLVLRTVAFLVHLRSQKIRATISADIASFIFELNLITVKLHEEAIMDLLGLYLML